jgi:hypothetical protein
VQGHGQGRHPRRSITRGRNLVDGELVPRSEDLAGAAPWEAVALDAMFARSGSGSAGRSDGLER